MRSATSCPAAQAASRSVPTRIPATTIRKRRSLPTDTHGARTALAAWRRPLRPRCYPPPQHGGRALIVQALTFGEAAGQLGLSSHQLADLVVGGALKVLPVGDVRLVPLQEVRRLAAERGRVALASRAAKAGEDLALDR